jgi:hypothetical protein
MKIYKSDKQRFIAGLIIITIIYSIYYIYFADNEVAVTIPRKIRHVIKFGTTILVYAIGSIHLSKLPHRWMGILWHIIHIGLLSIITLIGAYDWVFGMVNMNIKIFATSLQEILISPVLYFGMGILQRSLK